MTVTSEDEMTSSPHPLQISAHEAAEMNALKGRTTDHTRTGINYVQETELTSTVESPLEDYQIPTKTIQSETTNDKAAKCNDECDLLGATDSALYNNKLEDKNDCDSTQSLEATLLCDDAELTDKQKEKIDYLYSYLEENFFDISHIQHFAADDDGFVIDDLRKELWPKLLRVDDRNFIPLLTREEAKENSFYTQVVLDVERTLKRFPPGISPDRRKILMDDLIRIIITVLNRNPNIHYYQGYHDVGITLLLVCGSETALQLLEILSQTHLREFLQPTMDRTQRWLAYIYPMLEDSAPRLYQHMIQSRVGTTFCLPWLITWYSHTLSQYRQVVRLFDYLLSSPPLMPMYVAAEILLYREEDLLSIDCDLAMMHQALSTVPENLPLDVLLQHSRELYKRLPPAKLSPKVDRFLCDQEEREEAEKRLLRQAQVEKRYRARALDDAAHDRKLWQMTWWAWRVLATTPRGLYSRRGAVLVAVVACATALYVRQYGTPRMLQWW